MTTFRSLHLCKELDKWLEDVNKTGPPGNFMAWVYQHRMLPRILQPLGPDTVLVSEATLFVVMLYFTMPFKDIWSRPSRGRGRSHRQSRVFACER